MKHLQCTLIDVDIAEVITFAQNKTEKSIEAGLKDLQEIISGIKTGKSVKQLLDED